MIFPTNINSPFDPNGRIGLHAPTDAVRSLENLKRHAGRMQSPSTAQAGNSCPHDDDEVIKDKTVVDKLHSGTKIAANIPAGGFIYCKHLMGNYVNER